MTQRKKVFKGARLRQVRESRGYTQDELAIRLNLGQSQLNKYENNKSDPTPEVIVRLAKELNVTADWLLGLVDEPNENVRLPDLSAQELKLLQAFRRKNYQDIMKVAIESSE